MTQPDDQTPAKARSFFEKAQKVAETGNIDYAIDMYLQGLRHAPDALMDGHLPMAELAKWETKFAPVYDQWMGDMKTKGLPGKAAVDHIRKLQGK